MRGGIVAVAIAGIGVERVRNGGGNKENDSGDVMVEKESNTITEAIGEAKLR